MRSANFSEANSSLLGAAFGVDDLSVWRGDGLPHGSPEVASLWKPTWLERLSILVYGRVWLRVYGVTHAPLSVVGARTIFR